MLPQVFDIAAGIGCDVIKMMPYMNGRRQQWRIKDMKIVNGIEECLDIRGARRLNGVQAIPYHYKGSANQHGEVQNY